MSLILVTFSGETAEYEVPVSGFKIMEKDVWQKHLRDAMRHFEDDEVTFYFNFCGEDQIHFETFEEYSDAYQVKAVSDLQAEMIKQGVHGYDPHDGYGEWRQGDFDE